MADDSRLRVGGWVRAQGGVPGDPARPGAMSDPDQGGPEWPEPVDWEADDDTAAWERLAQHSDGDDGDSYRGNRRMGHNRASLQRLVVVAVAVGVLLIGIGALASSLSPDPDALPAPPATPDGFAVDDDATGGTARIGPAPTGSPGTTPAPPEGGEPPEQDGPGQDTPSPTPTPTTPPTTPPIASYESQDAELGNHTRVQSMQGASGGQVVEFTSGSHMASVEHAGVSAGASGQYRLTIHYLGEGGRVRVSVNGVEAAVVLPPTGGPDTAGSVTLSVQLTAGSNRVRIGSGTGGRGVLLDRITIAD